MNTPHTPSHERLDALVKAGEPLSCDGQARRKAMLGSLEGAVRARGRQRLAARGGLAVCGLLLVVGAVVFASWPNTGPASGPHDMASPDTPMASIGNEELHTDPAPDTHIAATNPAAPRLVVYVVNDPGIVARWAATPKPSRVEMLDDAGLLAELRAAGLPAGMIRRNDTLTLAFHNAPLPGALVPHEQGQPDSQ